MTVVQALVAMASHAVPGWAGQVVAEAAVPWHAEPGLAELRRHWATKHPEAGPHYAALRGWGLLVWQPAYLVVLAAHLSDVQVDLDRLSLQLREGDVSGYAVAEHAPLRGDEAVRLRTGAQQLAAGVVRLLSAWQGHAPLQDKAARRTVADCVLAALLAARKQRQWSSAHTRVLGEQWLAALDLRGESGYIDYRGVTGDEALALDRKVCCLHFRRRDGERCTTCPKRAPRERVLRLQAEKAAA
jgi:siderophore ferric iron reductase